jgi:hypothetical protein
MTFYHEHGGNKFDMDYQKWMKNRMGYFNRAIEKTPSPREFEERYRSTVVRRPGTAR